MLDKTFGSCLALVFFHPIPWTGTEWMNLIGPDPSNVCRIRSAQRRQCMTCFCLAPPSYLRHRPHDRRRRPCSASARHGRLQTRKRSRGQPDHLASSLVAEVISAHSGVRKNSVSALAKERGGGFSSRQWRSAGWLRPLLLQWVQIVHVPKRRFTLGALMMT
jgi:hypothetical protein